MCIDRVVSCHCRVPKTLTCKGGVTPVAQRQRRPSRTSNIVVPHASQSSVHQESSSRRNVLLNTAMIASVLGPVQHAQAFLGLGEDSSEKYMTETQSMIDSIRAALELAPNTDEREQAMTGVKKQTVAWVSAYRRDPKFAGRPSFSQMYSAVNALDGQLVSFGLKANFPAKRLERMMKSIDDAERQLKRGR